MLKPRKFGRYLLVNRLSVGGMAEVYLAKSSGVQGFEKLLAIKRILPSVSEDPDFETMFIDEAKISAQLAHSNVGQVLEFGQVDGEYYITMEYIPGKDLRTIQAHLARARRVMDLAMALSIASRICQALDYAHRQKENSGESMQIVHRDVSPPNIIISFDGAVKLIDFGIAKATSRATKTRAGKLKGKFAYMSPEQVQGMHVDHRTDVFSLGIVLHEMLTNRRLFVAENPLGVMQKVRKAEVAPPSTINPEVPLEVDRIVLKALARDRELRYGWASEMRADIERFFARKTIDFDTSKLRSWMHEEFAEAIEAERQLLIRISKLNGESPEELEAPQEPAEPEMPQESKEPGTPREQRRASGSMPPIPVPDPMDPGSDFTDMEDVTDLEQDDLEEDDLQEDDLQEDDLQEDDLQEDDLQGNMLRDNIEEPGRGERVDEKEATGPADRAMLVGIPSANGSPTPLQPVTAGPEPPGRRSPLASRAIISSSERQGAVVGGALEVDSNADRPLPRIEPMTPVDVRGIEGVVRSKRITPAFVQAAVQGQISGTQQVETRFGRLTSMHVIILAACLTLLLAGLVVLLIHVYTDSGSGAAAGGSGTGTIIVSTEPQAACTVSLDASPKGLVSAGKSLSLPGVPAGVHIISVTCLGYQPFSTSVQVEATEVSLVEARLQKE